jgi:hypothetical protein
MGCTSPHYTRLLIELAPVLLVTWPLTPAHRAATSTTSMDHAPQSVTRQRVRHGDSLYLVEVVRDDDGFHGEWVCATCGLSGHSSARYIDDATAEAWANLAVLVHNQACHAD